MKALIDIGRYGAEIITDDRVEWIPMEWLRAAYAASASRLCLMTKSSSMSGQRHRND
jgi:hypothetical protein